jgi:hypothetical protein
MEIVLTLSLQFSSLQPYKRNKAWASEASTPVTQGRNVDATYDFPFYLILPALLCPAVYTASTRNQYQKQKNNVSGQ